MELMARELFEGINGLFAGWVIEFYDSEFYPTFVHLPNLRVFRIEFTAGLAVMRVDVFEHVDVLDIAIYDSNRNNLLTRRYSMVGLEPTVPLRLIATLSLYANLRFSLPFTFEDARIINMDDPRRNTHLAWRNYLLKIYAHPLFYAMLLYPHPHFPKRTTIHYKIAKTVHDDFKSLKSQTVPHFAALKALFNEFAVDAFLTADL